MSIETRVCQNCKSDFAIAPDDFGFYEKIGVPPPSSCPVCRQRQRMLFRNFKILYKRNSDKSGASMLSMYSPASPYKVYAHDEWWADDWDAKEYGRPFDFNRPFFEQFRELLLAVPKFNFMNNQSENCDYANFTFRSKNCYMVFGCVNDENCWYGHIVWSSKDSLDNLYLHKSELCYECIDCVGCYRLLYSQECESCTDGIGLFDCRSCTNCIGCVGLRQKSYCIFNEQKTKKEYAAFVAAHPLIDPANIRMILEKREELRRSVPQRHFFGSRNDNVSGNHVYNARDVHDSFDVQGGEHSRFIYTSRNAKDSYDVAFSPDIEQCYQSLTTLGGNRVFFSHIGQHCSDMYYSDSCFTSSNVFGCAGLKGGEYCILNRQYSKDEYFTLKEKIVEHMKKIGEWGKFFPVELSPFCYNESIAQEYFPLSKGEALAAGFRWSDEIPRTSDQETIANDALPKNPAEFSEELLKHVLKCDVCSHNFRLIPQEIGFYKKMNLPLPRLCFNCRHEKRMASRNVRKLWDGTCAKCNARFRTSYSTAQQKEYRIYCENCYQAEVA